MIMDHEYIAQHVNPILEPLIIHLLQNKPDNITGASILWLQENGYQIESNLHNPNDQLLIESSDCTDEESDEDDNDIYYAQIRPDRASVCAEVYGQHNKKINFKPKIVPKSPEQIDRIRDKMGQSFMFSCLDEHEIRIVINAMGIVIIQKGQDVIRQGDDGNNLYIVDEGQLDCVKNKVGQEAMYLKTYQPGESFGELALLYNSPRQATITANVDCVLFSLDRETFNHIVKDSAIRKREKYEIFLAHVELLQDLDPYSRLQIADALRCKSFKPGEYIMKEGEDGDTFYFLEKGEAVATKVVIQSQPPQIVYQYHEGDYFGEIALLKNAPRAASIIATSPVSVVYLNRDSYSRLLGPLNDVLTRNFKKYEKFMH